MAKSKTGLVKDGFVPGPPKKTRQGSGKGTKYAATSRNSPVRFIAGRVNK